MRDPVLVDLDNYLDEEAKQEALQEAIDQKTDEIASEIINGGYTSFGGVWDMGDVTSRIYNSGDDDAELFEELLHKVVGTKAFISLQATNLLRELLFKHAIEVVKSDFDVESIVRAGGY